MFCEAFLFKDPYFCDMHIIKNLSHIVLFLLLITAASLSQENELTLKLKEKPALNLHEAEKNKLHPVYRKSDMPTHLFAGGIFLALINPVIVFEDKKVFWGLTKEISIAFFPYGRLNFEYSFLFRTFNKNHLRISYNYDFIEKSRSDWVMFRISTGAGYFTDTKNSGSFIQGSAGYFIASPIVIFDLYLKYRFTYTFNKNKSDIHDISLGMGFLF